MSYKLNLLILFLFFASLLEGQPIYSTFQIKDSLDLKALMTYSELELAQKVNEIYERIEVKDSISIQELFQELEFEKMFETIDLDSIIRRVDWNEALKDFDWNSILKDFDWNQMFADLCASKDTLLSESQKAQLPSIQQSNLTDLSAMMTCLDNNPVVLMQAVDMPCLMQKMSSGKISINDMSSLSGMCQLTDCMDLNKMYGGTDWNCMFSQVDMNAIMRLYDFKSILQPYDTINTKGFPSHLGEQIKNHPILHQLNPAALFKNAKANPSALLDIPEISTFYQNLYNNLISNQFQKSLKQNNSYLKSNLELFATIVNQSFDDKEAVKYYTTFFWLLYEMNLNTQNFQFAQAYEQQLVLKDILIYALRYDVFNALQKEDLSVRSIIGDQFEMDNLASIYQNIGYSLTQLGRFQDALSHFEKSIQLRYNLVLSFDTPFSVKDYFQLTYQDSIARLQVMNELGMSREAFDVYQLTLLKGQHPSFIQSLLENKEYTKANQSYQVFKDLLLIRDANNNIRPSFTTPNKLMDKDVSLKVLKGIYKNMADVEAKNPKGIQENLVKYQSADKVLNQFVQQQNRVITYHEMGNTYKMIGDLENSLANFNKAWKLLQQLENLDYLVWVLPGIGNFEEDYLNKMLLHVAVVVNISTLYTDQKDYTSASFFLENAIDSLSIIANKERASPAKAKVLNFDRDLFPVYANLGKIYLIQKKLKKAKFYLQKCQTIAEAWQQPLHIFYNALNLGEYYHYLQQPDSAFHYYQLAGHQAKSLDYKQGRALVYFRQGGLHQQIGHSTNAISYYDSCQTIANQLSLYGVQSGVQTLRGYLAKKDGKSQKALTHFTSAIEIIENDIFSNVVGEESRQVALENNFNAYAGAVSCALQLGKKAAAFQYVQQSKSRTFNDLLNTAVLKSEAIPTELKQTKQANIVALNANKKLSLNSKKSMKLIQKQKDLFNQKAIIDAQINALFPEYGQYDLANPIIIQQQLLPNQMFIEYFAGEEMYAFVITKNAFQSFNLGKLAPIQKALNQFKKVVDTIGTKAADDLLFKAKLQKRLLTSTQKLHALLLDTIQQNGILHRSINQLIIAPDQSLYLLPFELLTTQKATQPDFLLQNYTINYIQSGTTFKHYTKGKATKVIYPKELLVVGKSDFSEYDNFNPLKRINPTIFHTPKNKAKYLLEAAATLQNLDSLNLKDYRHIYMSTHGEIDPTMPDLSFLALTNSQFSVFNALDFGIKSELMILSGCKTGKGTFQRGGGVIGFTRGLMVAGTKSVIISLWSVEDEATEAFFDLFFQYLSAGKSAKDALQATKLDFMKSDEYSHPFDWAGFVLFGAK